MKLSLTFYCSAVTVFCSWSSWWRVEKLNHTPNMSVFLCERENLCLPSDIKCLYTRLWLSHPCRPAGVVPSPSSLLSPLPTCIQREKKKRLITKEKQTDSSDKTRERKTTATKIDWQHVYNNASGLCQSINPTLLGNLSRPLLCRGGSCNLVVVVIGWSS